MALTETKIKDVNWQEFEKEANKLKHEDLIDFIMKKTTRSKRELGKKIEMSQREYKVVDSYVSFLRSMIPISFADDSDDDIQLPEEERKRRKEGMKQFKANEGRKKQILVLKEEIKKKQEKVRFFKNFYNTFFFLIMRLNFIPYRSTMSKNQRMSAIIRKRKLS